MHLWNSCACNCVQNRSEIIHSRPRAHNRATLRTLPEGLALETTSFLREEEGYRYVESLQAA